MLYGTVYMKQFNTRISENMAFDISFCSKFFHLSESMQKRVIRGHWSHFEAL